MAGEAPSLGGGAAGPASVPGGGATGPGGGGGAADEARGDGQTVRGQLFICGPRYTSLQVSFVFL